MNLGDAHLLRGDVEALAATYWALAQLHRAQADIRAGLAMIERALEVVQAQSLTVMRRLLLAEQADLLVAQDRLEEAERWAREHRVGEAVEFGLPHERECLSLVRLRLARGEVNEALKLLARLLGPAEAAGRFGVVIELLAIQALALQESGKLAPALSSLERALALAEPEGYIRTFADHGEPMATLLRQVAARGLAPQHVPLVLAAIQQRGSGGQRSAEENAGHPLVVSGPWPSTPIVEPLTPREVEVIRLLADGASNRTEAAALARKLGLLAQS